MVEWCDDERDTRSAYISKSNSNSNSNSNTNAINCINAGTLAKQIAQQETKAKTGMGYNESVYVEYKYESLVKVKAMPYAYKDVKHVNEPTNETHETIETNETNETLLQHHKFAEM